MVPWHAGGLGDDDIDVAVFRFTLGIPGFDDRFIPRVVGLALGALLVVNHVLGADPTPEAQVSSPQPVASAKFYGCTGQKLSRLQGLAAATAPSLRCPAAPPHGLHSHAASLPAQCPHGHAPASQPHTPQPPHTTPTPHHPTPHPPHHPAQVRCEWLGALLASLCVLVPDIEERLREAMPGRGRQKAAEAIEGSANGFFLEPSLQEAAKKVKGGEGRGEGGGAGGGEEGD